MIPRMLENLVTEWEWEGKKGMTRNGKDDMFISALKVMYCPDSFNHMLEAGGRRPSCFADRQQSVTGRCEKVSKFNLHLSYCCYFNLLRGSQHSIPDNERMLGKDQRRHITKWKLTKTASDFMQGDINWLLLESLCS